MQTAKAKPFPHSPTWISAPLFPHQWRNKPASAYPSRSGSRPLPRAGCLETGTGPQVKSLFAGLISPHANQEESRVMSVGRILKESNHFHSLHTTQTEWLGEKYAIGLLETLHEQYTVHACAHADHTLPPASAQLACCKASALKGLKMRERQMNLETHRESNTVIQGSMSCHSIIAPA